MPEEIKQDIDNNIPNNADTQETANAEDYYNGDPLPDLNENIDSDNDVDLSQQATDDNDSNTEQDSTVSINKVELARLKKSDEDLSKKDDASEFYRQANEDRKTRLAFEKQKVENENLKELPLDIPSRVDDMTGDQLRNVIASNNNNVGIALTKFLKPVIGDLVNKISILENRLNGLDAKTDNSSLSGLSASDKAAVEKYIASHGLKDVKNKYDIGITMTGVKRAANKNKKSNVNTEFTGGYSGKREREKINKPIDGGTKKTRHQLVVEDMKKGGTKFKEAS